MLIYGFQLLLSAGAVSDFVLAASMLYFARTFLLETLSSCLKLCTQFISTKRTMTRLWSKDFDRRISKLIRSIFETGALCSATAFIDLVTYALFNHNFVHVGM